MPVGVRSVDTPKGVFPLPLLALMDVRDNLSRIFRDKGEGSLIMSTLIPDFDGGAVREGKNPLRPRPKAPKASKTCKVGLRNLQGWTPKLAWLDFPTVQGWTPELPRFSFPKCMVRSLMALKGFCPAGSRVHGSSFSPLIHGVRGPRRHLAETGEGRKSLPAFLPARKICFSLILLALTDIWDNLSRIFRDKGAENHRPVRK